MSTSTPVIDNLTLFNALMLKYSVPVNNQLSLDQTYEFGKAVKGKLFCGIAHNGLAFINLPITMVPSPATKASVNDAAFNWNDLAFIIIQHYPDRKDIFMPNDLPYGIQAPEVLGSDYNDLTTLEKLLAGETVRFHDRRDGAADMWTDVTLAR
jgi:hypothetical protein